jgi:hypothetical protein
MTSKLRVEFLQAAADDGPIRTLLASETVAVTGTAAGDMAEIAVAPAASSSSYGLIARLTAPVGAVVATWDGTAPSETNGLRIATGDPPVRVAVTSTTVFKFVESLDQPA